MLFLLVVCNAFILFCDVVNRIGEISVHSLLDLLYS